MIYVTPPGEYPHTPRWTIRRKIVVLGGAKLDDNRCKLLHRILNGLTVVVGQCELMHDAPPEEARKRLTLIEARAKELAELVLQHECQIVQYTAPEKRPPESVRNRTWDKIRKWTGSAAAD